MSKTSLAASKLAILTQLPPDVLRFLLGWMGPRRTALLGGTCKELFKLCSQDVLWKQFFVADFGIQHTEKAVGSLADWEKSLGGSASGKSFWKAQYSKAKSSFFARSHCVSPLAAFKATNLNRKTWNTVRVAILGAPGVGKSATTVQFVQGIFVDRYDPTIEDSYRKMVSFCPGCTHVLEVLDTASSEEFTNLRNSWMKDCEGVIVMYDVERRSTLEEAEVWLSTELAKRYNLSPHTHPVILVANKIDLERKERRNVSKAEGNALAQQYGVPYSEISAMHQTNIQEPFEMITMLIGAYRVLHDLASDSTAAQKHKEKEKCSVM